MINGEFVVSFDYSESTSCLAIPRIQIITPQYSLGITSYPEYPELRCLVAPNYSPEQLWRRRGGSGGNHGYGMAVILQYGDTAIHHEAQALKKFLLRIVVSSLHTLQCMIYCIAI